MKRGVGSMLVAVTTMLLAGSCRRAPSERPAPQRPPLANAVRMTMAALHASGGVPPRWRFTPPPGDPVAGKREFAALGCAACHKVRDAGFPEPTGNGPELTGMGSHHPAGYFAEAILNPDAVLVDGPGYLAPDGHSVMPMYPDLTLAQLVDLVAYVQSLTSGDGHAQPTAGASIGPNAPPTPPAGTEPGTAYLLMAYEVRAGALPALEAWFKQEGAAGFLGYPGLLGMTTYYDRTRTPPYQTVFAFADEPALEKFQRDPTIGRLGLGFDRFLGDHDHVPFSYPPPIYRVPSLSTP